MELLVVRYHYIDAETKYSAGIYPISAERLENQILNIKKGFEFICEDDLLKALRGEYILPKRSCLLTFDDGLLCQYENAVPVLVRLGVPAIFYINTGPIVDKLACHAHKVHYLLSKIESKDLINTLERDYFDIYSKHIDWKIVNLRKVKECYPYDESNAAKFKYLVNHTLNYDQAKNIISAIFSNYCQDEMIFCKNFYMSENNLKDLTKNDLFSLGLHSHSHGDITLLDKEEVENDVRNNAWQLEKISSIKARGMAYPYGEGLREIYEKKVIPVVNDLGLSYGFTALSGINKDLSDPFFLLRFDTNDVSGGKRPVFHITK